MEDDDRPMVDRQRPEGPLELVAVRQLVGRVADRGLELEDPDLRLEPASVPELLGDRVEQQPAKPRLELRRVAEPGQVAPAADERPWTASSATSASCATSRAIAYSRSITSSISTSNASRSPCRACSTRSSLTRTSVAEGGVTPYGGPSDPAVQISPLRVLVSSDGGRDRLERRSVERRPDVHAVVERAHVELEGRAVLEEPERVGARWNEDEQPAGAVVERAAAALGGPGQPPDRPADRRGVRPCRRRARGARRSSSWRRGDGRRPDPAPGARASAAASGPSGR